MKVCVGGGCGRPVPGPVPAEPLHVPRLGGRGGGALGARHGARGRGRLPRTGLQGRPGISIIIFIIIVIIIIISVPDEVVVWSGGVVAAAAGSGACVLARQVADQVSKLQVLMRY
jgi:hypothetical protein